MCQSGEQKGSKACIMRMACCVYYGFVKRHKEFGVAVKRQLEHEFLHFVRIFWPVLGEFGAIS